MQCIDERLKQIQQYRQLGSYSRGAKTMKKIKEMFGLSGDFSPVEILVGLVSSFIAYCLECQLDCLSPRQIVTSVGIFC